MKEYCITLINDDGPYFYVSADDFKITHDTITHKPHSIMFGINNENDVEVVCFILYRYVHEIADVTDSEYKKIENWRL